MSDPRREKLVGAWLTLPTFNDDGYNLLLDRQRIHLRWLMDNGFKEGNAVLMLAGGNGEGTMLNEDEWRSLANVLAEEAVGKVPTALGVYEFSARAAAKKAKYAANLGIDFIQLAPPHYMAPSDNDVFGYYNYVNDASDVGIVAYNLPWCIPGAYEFTQPLFERLATLENIVGIKWGCISIQHWAKMIRLFKHRFNFIEQGGILSVGFRLGIVGFTDTLGPVAPRLSLRKWELIRKNASRSSTRLRSRSSTRRWRTRNSIWPPIPEWAKVPRRASRFEPSAWRQGRFSLTRTRCPTTGFRTTSGSQTSLA